MIPVDRQSATAIVLNSGNARVGIFVVLIAI